MCVCVLRTVTQAAKAGWMHPEIKARLHGQTLQQIFQANIAANIALQLKPLHWPVLDHPTLTNFACNLHKIRPSLFLAISKLCFEMQSLLQSLLQSLHV